MSGKAKRAYATTVLCLLGAGIAIVVLYNLKEMCTPMQFALRWWPLGLAAIVLGTMAAIAPMTAD